MARRLDGGDSNRRSLPFGGEDEHAKGSTVAPSFLLQYAKHILKPPPLPPPPDPAVAAAPVKKPAAAWGGAKHRWGAALTRTLTVIQADPKGRIAVSQTKRLLRRDSADFWGTDEGKRLARAHNENHLVRIHLVSAA